MLVTIVCAIELSL